MIGQTSARNSLKQKEEKLHWMMKKEQLDKFLLCNDISFTLPGCKNQIYVGKDEIASM